MDLVSLNAGMLMSCKTEEDRRVQTGFQEHVGSYFQENCNGELILNNFSNLKKKVIYKYSISLYFTICILIYNNCFDELIS